MAEEQSDDEVRTSQVPERSEGKTKVIGQQSLPFTVLKLCFVCWNGHHNIKLQQPLPFTVLKHTYHVVAFAIIHVVATAPTVHGIETF